ncbi:MAG TPA: exodeoxyribonuclease III [candidate division Zixibacteria bacterium]|nr:exodeoxyribonuclease III [candidate division Zixibacteria bacterium]
MRIISWNVNGVRAVLKKGFIDWIEAESPDVLCLQETKLQADQIPPELIEPLGYKTFWSHAERKGYSGVATFIKGDFDEVRDGFGEPKFDSEGRTLVAKFRDFTLINGYFPNGGRGPERIEYKLDYYKFLLEFVNNIRADGGNVVITGDFNTAHNEIDLANPEANRNHTGFLDIEREWIDRYIESGLVDTFREMFPDRVAYTWWDYRTRARERDVGWRIDYFMVNREFFPKVKDAFILKDVLGSDHCPLGIEVNAR